MSSVTKPRPYTNRSVSSKICGETRPSSCSVASQLRVRNESPLPPRAQHAGRALRDSPQFSSFTESKIFPSTVNKPYFTASVGEWDRAVRTAQRKKDRRHKQALASKEHAVAVAAFVNQRARCRIEKFASVSRPCTPAFSHDEKVEMCVPIGKNPATPTHFVKRPNSAALSVATSTDAGGSRTPLQFEDDPPLEDGEGEVNTPTLSSENAAGGSGAMIVDGGSSGGVRVGFRSFSPHCSVSFADAPPPSVPSPSLALGGSSGSVGASVANTSFTGMAPSYAGLLQHAPPAEQAPPRPHSGSHALMPLQNPASPRADTSTTVEPSVLRPISAVALRPSTSSGLAGGIQSRRSRQLVDAVHASKRPMSASPTVFAALSDRAPRAIQRSPYSLPLAFQRPKPSSGSRPVTPDTER